MKKKNIMPMSLLLSALVILGAALNIVNAATDELSNNPFFEKLNKHNFALRQQVDHVGFRILPYHGVSGSAQFSGASLEAVVKSIRENYFLKKITIVDLRQETHLLGNGPYASVIAENDGSELSKSLEEINKDEKVFVKTAIIEQEKTIVENFGLGYIRFPVTDDTVPNESIVDEFVDYCGKLCKENYPVWLHIHCDHGKERTTTFMVMLQILLTEAGKDLDRVLDEQMNAGGADLFYPAKNKLKEGTEKLQKERYQFLLKFHEYVGCCHKDFPEGHTWTKWVNKKG